MQNDVPIGGGRMNNNSPQRDAETMELPTTIPIILNVVMILAVVLAIVEFVKLNMMLVVVWVLVAVVACCNSVAIQKMVQYLQGNRE